MFSILIPLSMYVYNHLPCILYVRSYIFAYLLFIVHLPIDDLPRT